MIEPLGRAETSRLLRDHGVEPDKRLGQHFLVDPNTTRAIVAAADLSPRSRVIEVGAGTGTLTRALAATGALVTAIEVDQRLLPVLRAAVEPVADAVRVLYGDAQRIDLAELTSDGGWTMVANLPYNVGTPIVLDALRFTPGIERFVVMLQREAVDRLAAEPGSRTYGLPSVVAQLHGSVRVALRISPHVFLPPPEVESAVAVIDRKPQGDAAARERAVALAAAAFNQRRKMIRTSLKAAVADPEALFERAGISGTARAENLSPLDYLRLAEHAD